jgi:DNA polymerase-3 subunit alpha
MAVMAAMVEGVQKRKTKRGKDFVVAEFSDSSGQFSASCFEESMVESFVQWARDGTCILLNVELDSPSPEEPPRVTIRGGRPLSEVREAARMELRLEIDRPEAVADLALILQPGAPGKGEVLARLKTGTGKEPLVRLGCDFVLDGDLAEHVSQIEGVTAVSLAAKRGPSHLRLVA